MVTNGKTNTMKKTLLLLTALASLTIAHKSQATIPLSPEPIMNLAQQLTPSSSYGSWYYSTWGIADLTIVYKWDVYKGVFLYEGVANRFGVGYGTVSFADGSSDWLFNGMFWHYEQHPLGPARAFGR